MKVRKAKNMSTSDWQTDQIVWWKGKNIDRQSGEFMELVGRAYRAMFEQKKEFPCSPDVHTRQDTLPYQGGT